MCQQLHKLVTTKDQSLPTDTELYTLDLKFKIRWSWTFMGSLTSCWFKSHVLNSIVPSKPSARTRACLLDSSLYCVRAERSYRLVGFVLSWFDHGVFDRLVVLLLPGESEAEEGVYWKQMEDFWDFCLQLCRSSHFVKDATSTQMDAPN